MDMERNAVFLPPGADDLARGIPCEGGEELGCDVIAAIASGV